MSRIRLFSLLTAFALLPAAAQAQTTITACYVPKTGSVYRIQAPSAPDACKSSHIEFSWTSPTVTYGPITTAGTNLVLQPLAEGSAIATCPAGSVALSGGYVNGGLILPPVSASMNGRTPDGTGWVVYAKNNSSSMSAQLIVQAYCTSVSP